MRPGPHILAAQRPAVVRAGAAHWPALARWTWEFLSKHDAVVPVEVGKHYLDPDHRAGVPMQFSRFLFQAGLFPPRTTGAECLYLAQTDIFEHIPALKADIRDPADWDSWVPASSREAARTHAWIGPAGSWTPLHRDPVHNLYCQVIGSKAFRLYAPQVEHALHPFADVPRRNSSRVLNPKDPDIEQFPDFPTLPYEEAVLEPGDVLYLPPRWWHYVESLTASAAISFWFTLPADAQGRGSSLKPLNLRPPGVRRPEQPLSPPHR